MNYDYELWQWDGDQWRLTGVYTSHSQATTAGRDTDHLYEAYAVARAGSQKADHMRANTEDRDAPYT